MPPTCLHCGADLSGRTARAKYCNRSCKSHYRWDRLLAHRAAQGVVSSHEPHAKICADCSNPFESQRKIQFRCPTCQKLSLTVRKRRGPCAIPVVCEICGSEFVADRRNAKVCPKEDCWAERKRRLANSLTEGRSTLGSAPRECVVCECEFAGHVNALICSRKCRLARNRELVRRRLNIGTYHCISCGVEIPPELNGREYRYTCSDVCRMNAMSAKNRRAYANNPHLRERMVASRRERKQTDSEYARHLAELDRSRRERQNQEKFQAELAALEAKINERK